MTNISKIQAERVDALDHLDNPQTYLSPVVTKLLKKEEGVTYDKLHVCRSSYLDADGDGQTDDVMGFGILTRSETTPWCSYFFCPDSTSSKGKPFQFTIRSLEPEESALAMKTNQGADGQTAPLITGGRAFVLANMDFTPFDETGFSELYRDLISSDENGIEESPSCYQIQIDLKLGRFTPPGPGTVSKNTEVKAVGTYPVKEQNGDTQTVPFKAILPEPIRLAPPVEKLPETNKEQTAS